MTETPKPDEGAPLNAVGRALDSRWMMALAVLAVLVAIAWALLERGPAAHRTGAPTDAPLATIELLGVPEGAEVLLDGREIESHVFGVTPGVRHALDVSDGQGRSWRQVFLAEGSLSLVVELRTHFDEVDVRSRGAKPPR